VVLDSEGLWAIARNDSEDARAVLAASNQEGVPVLVPAVVLAEALFGDRRDSRANQALKKLQVIPVTDLIARSAAELKLDAGMTGIAPTIDAIVVATSAAAVAESFYQPTSTTFALSPIAPLASGFDPSASRTLTRSLLKKVAGNGVFAGLVFGDLG